MNKEFEAICKEILENKEEAQKLAELKTPEEMYIYFKAKMPSLSEEEFDTCMSEALEAYSKASDTEPELVTELLDKVAGGSGLQKLGKQLMSGALALTAMAPAAMATDGQRSSTPTVGSVAVSRSSGQGFMAKVKRWVRNHKALSIVLGVAATAGLTLLVEHQVVNRFRKTDDKQYDNGKPSQRLMNIVKDMLKDKDIRKAIRDNKQGVIDDKNKILAKVRPVLYEQIQAINNAFDGVFEGKFKGGAEHVLTLNEAEAEILTNVDLKAAVAKNKGDDLKTAKGKLDKIEQEIKKVEFDSPSYGKILEAFHNYLYKHKEIRLSGRDNKYLGDAIYKALEEDTDGKDIAQAMQDAYRPRIIMMYLSHAIKMLKELRVAEE